MILRALPPILSVVNNNAAILLKTLSTEMEEVSWNRLLRQMKPVSSSSKRSEACKTF
jgi:hypothetical protein